MRRREFCWAVPAVLVAVSCGGDDDGGPRADAAPPGPDATRIDAGPATLFVGGTDDSSGHFHTFTVQCADLDAGTATYTAIGSGHTHAIELSGIQLANLAGGATVTFDTNDGHAHSWSVTKPSNVC